MSERKKRVLMVGEASYTYSGFGNYSREILKRLVATNKYEIAELASYGYVNDPRDAPVTWMIYPNMVRDNDPRINDYRSHPSFQFGLWRFDRVVLDFKPDIVIDIRDPWYFLWENDSAFRRFFHLVWMPTIDSAPQQGVWVDAFRQADGLFTYSNFGMEILKKQGGNKLKLQCPACPGVDLSIFKPVSDKASHKQKMGFAPNMNIIGTVMRNQKRKLYPDLLEAFRLFLDKCEEKGLSELAKNTYLFIHTSYPDSAGWNFPLYLKEYNISHKVLFSYICRNCSHWFPSHFQDALTICPRCKQNAAILPNVTYGVSTEVLANIIKVFDLYVQYAICEGAGIPIVESLSCGIPVATMPYSAMKDVVDNSGAIPLPIAKIFPELETQAFRAMPDNDGAANELLKFFQQPFHIKQKMSVQARLSCEKYYNWDNTAKIWENYLDNVELKDNQGKWDETPPDLFEIPTSIPPNLSNEDFVTWLYYDVIHRPDLRYTLIGMKLCTDLNLGVNFDNGIRQVNREELFKMFRQRAEGYIQAEKFRCGLLPLANEDYVDYARLKQKSLQIKDGDIIQ